MKGLSMMLCASLLTLSAVGFGAEETSATVKQEHPRDTAMVKAADGTIQFKSFPESFALYVFTGDRPGESKCGAKCGGWPPLAVSEGEQGTRVGDWTVIIGQGGSRQWAYKGQPVYTRAHNLPYDAWAEEAGFRPLKP
jgi:predicted lipoprotein with Yx(FWY)xxD motif